MITFVVNCEDMIAHIIKLAQNSSTILTGIWSVTQGDIAPLIQKLDQQNEAALLKQKFGAEWEKSFVQYLVHELILSGVIDIDNSLCIRPGQVQWDGAGWVAFRAMEAQTNVTAAA